jgi:hypothetical protein
MKLLILSLLFVVSYQQELVLKILNIDITIFKGYTQHRITHLAL